MYVHGYCKHSRALTNMQLRGRVDPAHLDWAPLFLNLNI